MNFLSCDLEARGGRETVSVPHDIWYAERRTRPVCEGLGVFSPSSADEKLLRGGEAVSRLSFVIEADHGCANTELGEEPGSEWVSPTSLSFVDSNLSGVSCSGLATIGSDDIDSWFGSSWSWHVLILTTDDFSA